MNTYTVLTSDIDASITFQWHNSHTISVFYDGREVDVLSLYPDGGRVPTLAEVSAACEEYLADEGDTDDEAFDPEPDYDERYNYALGSSATGIGSY